MLPLRPALASFLDAVRGFERVADPKVNPRLARLQQPVPKVSRLARQFDAFEDAHQSASLSKNFKQASSATAQPRPGATHATSPAQFLQRDGFDGAARKPVELAPKPPPSYRAPVAVFRFR